MGGRREGRSSDSATERALKVYKLPDPELRAYDHGIGTLRVDGELRGHLASVVLEMRFPSRQPWLWFVVVVWLDGSKEAAFEDYGDGWWTVRELDAGYLEHYGPSVKSEKRFLWMKLEGRVPGAPCTFEFDWLPAEEAAQQWQELGLVDADF